MSSISRRLTYAEMFAIRVAGDAYQHAQQQLDVTREEYVKVLKACKLPTDRNVQIADDGTVLNPEVMRANNDNN